MFIKQLSIFIENRKGRLAEITDIIAKHNINIKALSIADTTNFGILRIIVDDPYSVESILRNNQITVSVTTVIGLAVPDKPGGIAAALLLLSENGITVEYMYGFMSKNETSAFIVLRVDDEFKSQELLKTNGYSGYIN
ncbi:MAG: ACT domain-containing protein [Eubacteriales bacterium]